MKFIIKITTILSVLTLLSGISVAKIYKWVDENGRVHFSDVKPKGITEVEEPYNKLKNVKTKAKPADIERYYPGIWVVDRTEKHDGNDLQITGTITFERNGVVTSELTAKLSANDSENTIMTKPINIKGSWYQSDNTEVTSTLVTTLNGKVTTQTQTQAIIEINSQYLKTMTDEGKKETLFRQVKDESR